MANNRFEHGSDAIKAAKRYNCKIVYTSGSHVKVWNPQNTEMIPVPNHKLGTGLGCKIFKWFIKWGMICLILVVVVNNVL